MVKQLISIMLLTTFLLFLGRSYGYAQEHKGFSMMGIGFGAGFGEQAEDYMTSLNFSFSINKHLRSDLGFSSLHSTLWGEQIDPTGFIMVQFLNIMIES